MTLFNKLKSGTNEFAREIKWHPIWETGAPMPQVFSNSQKIYLIYLIAEFDPKWDGSYVTMIDNTSGNKYPLALVEFKGHTFRFGIANDEVFSGLPLWKKGLKEYSAHIIENSNWINKLKQIHKVHPRYSESRWTELKHFVLLFHDEIFEVIAKDYKIEVFNTAFEGLATVVAKRMNKK